MTTAQAVRLALRAIAAECRRLAVDANLAERLGATYPGAREAAKLRGLYRQAAEVLAAGADDTRRKRTAGNAGSGAKAKA